MDLASFHRGLIPGSSVFPEGVSVSLINGTDTISGVVITRTPTRLMVLFDIRGALGSYNLIVSNQGNPSPLTRQNAFTVLPPGDAPVINGISPASGFNTANLPVTITGSRFNSPTVTLTQGSISRVASNTAGRTQTATTLFVTLPLSGLPGGIYNLTIRNSNGGIRTANEIFF